MSKAKKGKKGLKSNKKSVDQNDVHFRYPGSIYDQLMNKNLRAFRQTCSFAKESESEPTSLYNTTKSHL